jgi:hypothetical protein
MIKLHITIDIISIFNINFKIAEFKSISKDENSFITLLQNANVLEFVYNNQQKYMKDLNCNQMAINNDIEKQTQILLLKQSTFYEQARKTMDTLPLNIQFDNLKNLKLSNLSAYYNNLITATDTKDPNFFITATSTTLGSISKNLRWFQTVLPVTTLMFTNNSGVNITKDITVEQATLIKTMINKIGIDYGVARDSTVATINNIKFVNQTSINTLNAINELATLQSVVRIVNVDSVIK